MELEKLEVGKWYTNRRWTKESSAKLNSKTNGFFNKKEYILNESYQETKNETTWSLFENQFTEVSIDYLKKYLPQYHPDLNPISKEVTNEKFLTKFLIDLGIT